MSVRTAPIQEIFEFVRNGLSVKQDKTSNGLPITRIETISNWVIDLNKVGFAGLEEAGNEKWLLRDGDILLSHINSPEHIGKCALYHGKPPKLIHGMNLLALRPKRSLLDPRYAYRALSSPEFRASLQRFVNKAVNQASVSATNLKSLHIPIPPLDEQRRIAAILDKADALRRKRKRALDLLDGLTQSIFLEMFGDAFVSCDSSASHIVELSKVTRRITYGFTQPMSHHESGIPIITAKNVRSGFIDFENVDFACRHDFEELTDKSKPEPGDILVTKDGAIGRSAIFEGDSDICINQSVALVKPDHSAVNSVYLLHYLLSSPVQARIERMKKGNAMPHLHITALAKFPITIPNADRQAEFACRVKCADKLVSVANSTLASNDALFASLQYRAFSGQL